MEVLISHLFLFRVFPLSSSYCNACKFLVFAREMGYFPNLISCFSVFFFELVFCHMRHGDFSSVKNDLRIAYPLLSRVKMAC